jgi:hypothetical protein
MKIEYFERDNVFWGLILRRNIEENSLDYISHTENTVTYKVPIDEIRYGEVTATRNFDEIRDELILSHKENIAELQNEINILTVDTFEKYQKERFERFNYA